MLCGSSKIVFIHLFQYLCCLVSNSSCKIFKLLFLHYIESVHKTRKVLGLLVKAIQSTYQTYLVPRVIGKAHLISRA